MKVKVLSPSFSKNEKLLCKLIENFPDSESNFLGKRFNQDELVEFINDAEGVIVGLEKIDKHVINACKKLKIISKYGVGLDNIDIEECNKKNIKVLCSNGTNSLSVAEMTLCFMLGLFRNIFFTSNDLKSGLWNKSGGNQLSSKIIGVIGVGNIGKQVIRLLKPFNCKILVNDIIDQKVFYYENGLYNKSKNEIFSEADLITIHTPLTTQTEQLIDKKVLLSMKKSSFLINTARGKIVIQEDLKFALTNNIIAGAAIDVFEDEPPTDSNFLQLPNLLCTPHIGGNAYEAVIRMGMDAIDNLKITY